MMDWGIQFLDQSTTLSLIVELNGTDLQISPFLKFKEGSEAQTLYWFGTEGIDASGLSSAGQHSPIA